jgi:hypothetical protein
MELYDSLGSVALPFTKSDTERSGGRSVADGGYTAHANVVARGRVAAAARNKKKFHQTKYSSA